MLIPRRVCVGYVKFRIASYVYGCATSEVYLYKSGRSALVGLMEALRVASSKRRVAYVPDYVCNVVGEACRIAGFTTVIYPTDQQCIPDWKLLTDWVRNDVEPVVVLCSLFGSVPAQALEAETLGQSNPRVFIVADECQNLIPFSIVKPRSNWAVVFSFNDKSCPGIMGGGVVCLTDSGLIPIFQKGLLLRRVLCSVALVRQWLFRIGRVTTHIVHLACRRWRPITYQIPERFEFSNFIRPHYDLVPESIYKLSACRGCVSLLFLGSYHRIRIENAITLQTVLSDLQIGFDLAVAQSGPPFLPVLSRKALLPDKFPVPVKAPYGISDTEPIDRRRQIALKINIPYVRYKTHLLVVGQLTIRHAITDNRILHCMARTAETSGYQSFVMGPSRESGSFCKVQLRPCPDLIDGRRYSYVWLMIQLLCGALKSRSQLFQIHDPDLLPVGLILKMLGWCVIYDVHDDYEASLRDRFSNSRWIRILLPAFWWLVERNAARVFDGVVVADRHLAKKFIRCHPVILGNYPRLSFTPQAQADHEKTFNLIYVGGVSCDRGLKMVLKALRLLAIPELRLHVIGAGRDECLTSQLQANPQVVMHGRIPWTELYRYYVKAHVGLALYQPLEGFVTVDHSVKIVEYMAAGIPVLCSNFLGLKAFVEDSGCGMVVQPDDPEAIAEKIQHLFESPDLRKKLGANGRYQFESEFNWEKHEHKLIELYQRILDK